MCLNCKKKICTCLHRCICGLKCKNTGTIAHRGFNTAEIKNEDQHYHRCGLSCNFYLISLKSKTKYNGLMSIKNTFNRPCFIFVCKCFFMARKLILLFSGHKITCCHPYTSKRTTLATSIWEVWTHPWNYTFIMRK